MAFDGFITKSIVTELNSILSGGKINKIYQPNKNELTLDIYNQKKYLLNICIDSSNCRINLTKSTKSNPKIAPNFCMVLRKYINGSRIKLCTSYELDRIIIIDLENYNELNDLVSFKLIIELMGKHSNVILLNNKDYIIDSMRHISSNLSFRNILPANPYTFPISDKLNLLTITKENFINTIYLEQNKNLVNIFSNLFTGISKSFMLFTLEKLNISSKDFNNDDLIKLYNYIKDLILSIDTNKVVCKPFILNSKDDFCITISNEVSHNDVNEFIDNFYTNKENKETFINYRNSVLKLILSLLAKYNKKLSNIQEKLEECKDMEKYKLYGELITSNLYKINNNINIDKIILENYYDNNNLINITLDKKISPSYNAKKFFKKYNKLKNTLNIVSIQKEEVNHEINYLESIVYSLENCTTINEIAEIYEEIEKNILKLSLSKKSTSKTNVPDIKKLNIDGFTVYIGKNNTQNDIITFKLSNKNDIWFHVQGTHGSHVVLKTDNVQISEDNPIILKCAKLAALHSKSVLENKVLVDYTLIKNLRKPNGAKPGFVIFNTYKTIIVSN